MTPEEAKTKWCPFFRSKGPLDQWSDNRDHGGAGFCIGPACMAWRRFDGLLTAGYCGLAGKDGAP